MARPSARLFFRFVDRACRCAGAASATLAACGGGGSTDDAPTALAAPSASRPRRARRAGAAAKPTGSASPIENQTFSVQGTQTVRYGSRLELDREERQRRRRMQQRAGSAATRLVGVVKECQVGSAVDDRLGRMQQSGLQRAGHADGPLRHRRELDREDRRSGSAECSNEWFGSDPAVGVVKVCQGAGGSAVETGWARVAGEGESFAVNGTQTVRYGSGSAWVTKTVDGGGAVHATKVRRAIRWSASSSNARCRRRCGGAVARSAA